MQSSPLISVIIPCYNQAQFIDDCLQSLKNQTYKNWEAIIVNDGSTDGVEKIIAKWIENDSRFRCITTKNMGLSSARNTGMRDLRGEYIQFLDSDDWLDSKKFETCINEMLKNVNVDIALSDFTLYNNVHKRLEPAFCEMNKLSFSYIQILHNWNSKFTFPPNCGFFRTSLLKDFKFNETLKMGEDWLMWLYAFKNCRDYIYINKPLAVYRIHGNSMTRNFKDFAFHTSKVIEHVYEHELHSEEERNLFFKSAGNMYLKMINNFLDRNDTLTNSLRYKIGNILVSPFSLLRRIKVVDNFMKKRNPKLKNHQ